MPHDTGQYVLNVDVQILGSLQLTNVLSTHVLVVTFCAENTFEIRIYHTPSEFVHANMDDHRCIFTKITPC